MKVLFLIF